MGNRRRNGIVLAIVLGLLAASAYLISAKSTVLGLDLRGGTELVYEGRPTPQVPEVTGADVDRAIEIIRERVDTLGVAEPEITRVGERQIEVGLPDVEDSERAIERVGTTAQLYFYDWEGGPGEESNVVPRDPDLADPFDRGYNRLYDAVIAASKRDPECFEKEVEGGDPERLCTENGPIFYLFDKDTKEPLAEPATNREDLFATFDDQRPPNAEIVEVPQGTVVLEQPQPDDPGTEENESETQPSQFFVLRDRPELTGDDIRNPEQSFDQITNQPNVTFDFTTEGAAAFEEVTERIAARGADDCFVQSGGQSCANVPEDVAANFSGSFAVVLDGVIESRPIINFVENPAGIDGDTGAQISGLDSQQEAADLAEVLRIGALPIDLVLISQSTVSATLGEQALDQGLKAGLAGLVIVLLFLVAYYRFLGIVAGLGLLVYAVFFFALIKLIPITLTLPGIAGLILTIGVAADSNIVIFERIKEEVAAGRSMLSAISEGYKKGIATIIDANVITLITAFILFVLASAGVKGFAFTLGIGTIVSLFTAVLFTQAVLGVLGRAKFLRRPSFLGASEEGHRWNFDFTGASRWFFSISGAILLIGGVAFASKQLNLGIDFESGTQIQVALGEAATVDDIRSELQGAGIEGVDSAKIQEVENPDFGANVYQVQGKIPTGDARNVEPALAEAFGIEETGEGGGIQIESIGPTFGEQVARSAVIAIIFSLLVISAYVAIRFEAKYAVPVLIALVHDILITGGVYALLGAEVSSATVAAFLTILGYSMYDCIIVFDRIRENVPRMPRAAFSQIVNRSMSEILTRSLITGLSAVFLVGMLLAFGGETLGEFALAMMIGIFSGTYSSIFIASPVLTAWKEREPAYRSRRARIEEAMGYVPTFPEQNQVAKIDEAERHVASAAAGDGAGEPARPQEPPEPAERPVAKVAEPVERSADPEPTAEESGEGVAGRPGAGAERTQGSSKGAGSRKSSRRRRKHGRRR